MDANPLAAHITPLNTALVARWAKALELEGSIYEMMDASGRRALAAGTLQIFQHSLSLGRIPAAPIMRFVDPPPYREQPPEEFTHAAIAVYGMLRVYFDEVEAEQAHRDEILARLGALLGQAVTSVLNARFNRQRKAPPPDECARILGKSNPDLAFNQLAKILVTELGSPFCGIFSLAGLEMEHLGSTLAREISPKRVTLSEIAEATLLHGETIDCSMDLEPLGLEWLRALGFARLRFWPLEIHERVVGFILLVPPAEDLSKETLARLKELTPVLAPHVGLQQASVSLRRAEATIDELFDASPNMMCAVDRLGRVLRTNSRFRAEIGVQEGVAGMPFSWLVHPAWVQRFQNIWEQITREEVEGQFRVDLITAHSSRLPLSVEARWLKDDHHPPMTCMLALWNVSEQLAQLEEDQRRIEDLTAFAHQIAHDLKSPLRTISSFTDLLLEDLPEGSSEEVREHAQRIEQAAAKGGELIEGLLAFAQATEGRGAHIPVEIKDLLDDAAIRLKGEIEAAGARIEIAHDECPLLGQRIPLSALLANLISNALRYSDEPQPRIEISVQATQEGWAVLSVRDWGVGVAEEDQERIFKLFKRARSDRSGTGVGLAIVDRIAKAHGGAVSVRSILGEGSTFDVRLPTP